MSASETEKDGDSWSNAGVLFPLWEPEGGFSVQLATNRVSRQQVFPQPRSWLPATIVPVLL